MRVLAVACVCLAAPLSPGTRDNAAYAQTPLADLSGWLTVAWPDAQPAQPGEPAPVNPDRPVYTLHTDEGQRWRIESQAGQPPPDFRLAGRRVTATLVRIVARPAVAGGREAAFRGGIAQVGTVRPAVPDGVAGALVEAAVAEAAAVVGSQRWVTIACKFADVATEPKSPNFFSGMYASSYPGLDHYWREQSFGAVNVQGSTAHGWFTLPHARSNYIPPGASADLDRLAEDCTAAAEPSVEFSTVKGINLMFNSDLDGPAWGGTTYLLLDGVAKSWRVTWEPPWAYSDISVVEHEMGHGFGWPHSSGDFNATYDNAWDVMSKDRYNCSSGSAAKHATYGCTGQHTIAYHKYLADWIPPARRYTLPPRSSPTAITLEPLAGLPLGSVPAGNYLMAQAQTGESNQRFFSVEVRKRSGYDAKLHGDGVIIHEVIPNRTTDTRPAHLMDADTTNEETADAGALWTVGETFIDATSGISIRVDSATATGYVVTLSSSGVSVGPPSVTSVSPTSGAIAGGSVVTVSGGGFTADATVYFGTTPSTTVNVASATSLTATAPAHADGPVAVSVTTPGGTASTGANGFTYIAAPAITSISPTTGPVAGGTIITVNGSGFVAGGTTVSIGGTPVTASLSSTTRLTAVTPAHTAGAVAVSVTTNGGTSLPAATFTYAAPQPAPTVTSVTPPSGPAAGGTAIAVQGSGFVVSRTMVSVGGSAATNVNVIDSARLTAVTPAHTAGAATVEVTTDWGTSSPGPTPATFTYVNPTPTITGITPSAGAAYSSTPVVITGSNFTSGLTRVTFGSAAAASVTVSGPTTLSCTAPQLAPGPVTVTVANGTATATSTFTYLGPPTLSSVTPSSGTVAGGTPVSITGANFVAGMSVGFDGVPATNVSVATRTQLTAVTPPHAAGTVSVRLQSGAGSITATPGFTYRAAPTVTSVSPSSGATAGGTTITVTGTGFLPGETAVTVGGVPATNVSVTNTILLTAVTPVGHAGAAAVSATTAGGTGSLAAGFSYVASASTPGVLNVAPSSGPAAGGTRLTITGSNFSAGQTTVTVGGVPATDVVVESPTLVRATTPAGADGSYANVAVTTPSGSASKLSAYWHGTVPALNTAALHRAETGWQLTLTGDGFYPGVLSVSVGTAAALEVLVVDRWHVVALAPLDLVGQRGVTVTTPAGTATTSVQFPSNATAYLAEGATGPFFDLDIAIANPHPSPVAASVTFLRSDGPPIRRGYELPALSRLTVAADSVPGLDVGQVSVSTLVESAEPLVVERTMFWSQERYYGGHGGSAVGGASRTWYFAEGFQGFFDTYLLLANASESPAAVTLRFLREWEPPFVTSVTVAANARQTVYTGLYPELTNRSFAVVVDSDVPVIAERAMYFGAFPFWKGGHESAGVPAPALQWSLAEGATGNYFDTYVLVANPNSDPATVTFRFLLSGENEGQTYTKVVHIPGASRFTLNPETLALSDGFTKLANTAVSTVVTSTLPIVVERAMYWGDRTGSWTEAHNSFGVTEGATRWGLAEGRVGGPRGFETFVLLANASATDAVVKLTFMREAGAPIEQTVTVAAASRYNVYVNGAVPGLASGERFGVLVESQPVAGVPAGVPIVVERAMYWNSDDERWAGGTNATGVKLP